MNIHEAVARKVLASGHKLFNCHCGRIHVDPMGMVNPKGWTPRGLLIMYLSALVGAALLVWGMTFIL